MKGLDLTLTTTFTGVNADYSSDVFWQKGNGSTKALYTKAVPNGKGAFSLCKMVFLQFESLRFFYIYFFKFFFLVHEIWNRCIAWPHSNLSGQTVTTAYNSIAKTLTTVLKMKAYTLGDQTIFVTFNRTDTNLNAKTTFTIDQFGKLGTQRVGQLYQVSTRLNKANKCPCKLTPPFFRDGLQQRVLRKWWWRGRCVLCYRHI